MKKFIFITGIIIALFCFNCHVFAQIKTVVDASKLISDVQISGLFGCKVKLKPPTMKCNCYHVSDDKKVAIAINATPFKDKDIANDMLKMNYTNCCRDISTKKKTIAVYDSIQPFPTGGENAHCLSGKGDKQNPGDVTRLQFVSGNTLITFDTKGVDRQKVFSNLFVIYAIMKSNNR